MHPIFSQFGRFRTPLVKLGILILLLGQLLLALQGIIHLARFPQITSRVLESENMALIVPVVFLLLDGLACIPRKRFQNFVFFLQSVGFSGGLYIGGGWYVGSALGLVGLGCIFYSAEGRARLDRWPPLGVDRKKVVVGISFCALCAMVTITGISLSYLPPALFVDELYEGMNGPPNANNTFYILTIGGSFPKAEDAAYYQAELGTGSDYVKIGFSCSAWYMQDLNDAANNYTFNASYSLYKELNYSVQYNSPVLVHMNGGNWGMYLHNTNLTYDAWMNASCVQWDQFDTYPDEQYNVGGLTDRLFSLSKYTHIYAYRRMNVKIAAQILKNFADQHPDLFVGVSMDSEIHMGFVTTPKAKEGGVQSFYDYNPFVIREFQEWLQTRYDSISALNLKFGLEFSDWSDIDPPREMDLYNDWWQEWTDFRISVVKANVDAEAQWITEEGIPQSKIYAHQILTEPGNAYARYIRCDPIETANIPHGNIGVTRYGMIDAAVFKGLYKLAGFNWGIFEWNIWSDTLNTYENYLTMLRSFYQYGLRVVCPYAWLSGYPYGQLQIANNTNFKRAIRDFAQMVGDMPRGTDPQGFMTFSDILESQYVGAKNYFDKNWFYLFIPLGGFLVSLIPLQIIKKKEKKGRIRSS